MQHIKFEMPGYRDAVFHNVTHTDEIEITSATIGDRWVNYPFTSGFVDAARQILVLPEVSWVKPSAPCSIVVYSFTRLNPESYGRVVEILDALCPPTSSSYPKPRLVRDRPTGAQLREQFGDVIGPRGQQGDAPLTPAQINGLDHQGELPPGRHTIGAPEYMMPTHPAVQPSS